MKKWNVTISFTIQAETRHEAWKLSQEVCRKHLRDLATVEAVTSNPVSNDWIAVNEPIRNQPVKIARVAETGEVVVSPLES